MQEEHKIADNMPSPDMFASVDMMSRNEPYARQSVIDPSQFVTINNDMSQ